MLAPQLKAKELKAQFGDNAKYVASEIMDEIKMFEYGHPILLSQRLDYWQNVKSELEKSCKQS